MRYKNVRWPFLLGSSKFESWFQSKTFENDTLHCAVVAFSQYISSKRRGTNTTTGQMNSEAECFQEKITLDISQVKQLTSQHKKSNSQPSLEQIASVNTFSSESETN